MLNAIKKKKTTVQNWEFTRKFVLLLYLFVEILETNWNYEVEKPKQTENACVEIYPELNLFIL